MNAVPVLENKFRKFDTLEEYFAYICDSTGNPHFYEHFDSDRVYSDGNYLHLDIFEVDVNAPTVIVIHGTALYSMIYGELIYKLGLEGYNVVGVDLRGHGRSEGARGDYTISELVQDVENVITYVQHEFNDNLSLLGSSQGGIVAFYTAAKDPRVKAVTCHNFADISAFESIELVKFKNLVKLLRPVMKGFRSIAPNPQIPIDSYLDLASIDIKHFGNAKDFIENDPIALKSVSLRALRSLTNTKLPCKVEEFDKPIFVFQGEEDNIFPVNYTMQLFTRLNCRKRIKIFDGLNHACVNNDVDIILPYIVNWLRDVHHAD